MILRRFTDAFRRQDWFTVTIETLMVVLGVFLGLQVNNWNDARADGQRSREYLSRIRAELVADMTELERNRGLWQKVSSEGYAAVSYAETGARGGATDWEILRSFLNASQSFQFTFVDTTYSELRSSGELRLIADANLRSGLADYYVLVAARRVVSALTSALIQDIIRIGWGKPHGAFRQVLGSLFMPEGTSEQFRWFDELSRISMLSENALQTRECAARANVEHLLAQIKVPTIVLHAADEILVPFSEARFLAARIPGARLVPLESKNHLILEHEPAWRRFLSEVERFIAGS